MWSFLLLPAVLTAQSRGVVRWRTRCLVVDADGIAPHVMHQGIVLATDLPDMIEGVVVTGLETLFSGRSGSSLGDKTRWLGRKC